MVFDVLGIEDSVRRPSSNVNNQKLEVTFCKLLKMFENCVFVIV